MTRRQHIEHIIRSWPGMRLRDIKSMVREEMAEEQWLAEENPMGRIRRLRRDEGEWALHR